MIEIPQADKKYSQPNTSDLMGNLFYTKNLDFDEEGYIKLSSRSISFFSNGNDANFGIPYAFGRSGFGIFNIASGSQQFTATITPASVGVSSDGTGATIPVGSVNTRGIWWRNKWHVTSTSKLFTKDSSNTWADTGLALTSGVEHPMCVFRSKPLASGQLCVGNGNTVLLLDSSYSTILTLTLQTDYEVIGLAYNNQKIGIVTKLAATLPNQNQEAYFFTWDGATTAANIGLGIGSDAGLQVVAYKSSFAILARNGKGLYFNGGGFDELFTLPYFFKKLSYTAGTSLSEFMVVEGDLIYINLTGSVYYFGLKNEQQLQNFPGGIHCYDPKVGLYHRYSPSVSPLTNVLVAQADVNITTGIMTASSGTIPATGNPILYSSDSASPIGGLMLGKIYYVIRVTSTQFKLATTKENAIAGTYITLTSQGASSNVFLMLNLLDYGTTFLSKTAGMALMGITSQIYDHLILGNELYDHNSSGVIEHACLTIPRFPNIGYFVTPRITSQELEDNYHKILINHRPLDVNDKIIVKWKKDEAIGIPVMSSQLSKICSWTSDTVFTTTADISEADAYLDADRNNELECEIVSGAGAGQMAQISSIVLNGSTYTVTLEESIEGATNGFNCNIIIDNWRLLKTKDNESELDSDNALGYGEFPAMDVSDSAMFKVILKGVKTAIRRSSVINKVLIPLE